ncbi:MAG TPA: neutral/alkaline non-lysosomal ceramidase N-terminal domain-containing protein [Gemmatimonadales bacterium]
MPRRPLVLAAVLATASCAVWHAQPLPAPLSREMPGTGRLRAGFARVDLTPPPGVGLSGNGPEGRRSTGYRTRLHVGALVLEDPGGERIGLVVADLAHVPANLHRLAAARLVERTGIGADRLLVSATHTHSGPGNFYGERQYNANTARVAGYDPRVTDFIVERITAAVERAASELQPAAIAWGETAVHGVTTNRSLVAFCRNPEAAVLCLETPDPRAAVDPALVMLRVDALDSRGGRRPLGTYSVLALHGTAIPNLNTLYDGDAQHRIVARLAERAGSPGDTAVHLLANGAVGDVSPDIERDRCDPPGLGFTPPVPAPRGPGESVDFMEPPAAWVERCLADALDDVETIADSVADFAVTLYRRLENRLVPTATIRRAFSADWLPGRDSLCGLPVLGSATAAGAELQETRVRGWRWLVFPVLSLGFEEGGSAITPAAQRCHSPKRALLDPFQTTFVVGEHGFPEVAQLSVVRVGDVLLATVPAEPTTMVGQRLRRAIEEEVRSRGGQVRAVVVGLTNGFLQYVTTAEEYQVQSYEGASNLYGPGTAGFLQHRMVELTRLLISWGEESSPAVDIGPITAYPGPVRAILPRASALRTQPGGPLTLRCVDGLPTGDWLDQPPADVLSAGTPWVALEREDVAGWRRVAEDGDGRLELHARDGRARHGFAWRAIWRARTPAGRYRLVRLNAQGEAVRTSDPVQCGFRSR